MTQDEQDFDLITARHLIPSAMIDKITIERSRHELTTQTRLWVFDTPTNKQIGTVGFYADETPQRRWKANRLHMGSPTTERFFTNMFEALNHVFTKGF